MRRLLTDGGARLRRIHYETGPLGVAVRFASRLCFTVADWANGAGFAILRAVPKRVLTRAADRQRLARNGELAGRHRGERCFIIGNGPSLRAERLEFLKNEICITVNRGHLFAEMRGLKPRYHAVIDQDFLDPSCNDVIGDWSAFATRNNATLLLSSELSDRFATLGHTIDSYEIKQFLSSKYFDEATEPDAIDLTTVQPGYVSVIHFAIATAIYMGFSEIALLGCDMDFFATPHEPLTHSYDGDATKPLPSASTLYGGDQIEVLAWTLVEFKAFRQLGRQADRLGVRIVNASEHGILDVFPRVRLVDLMRRPAAAE